MSAGQRLGSASRALRSDGPTTAARRNFAERTNLHIAKRRLELTVVVVTVKHGPLHTGPPSRSTLLGAHHCDHRAHATIRPTVTSPSKRGGAVGPQRTCLTGTACDSVAERIVETSEVRAAAAAVPHGSSKRMGLRGVFKMFRTCHAADVITHSAAPQPRPVKRSNAELAPQLQGCGACNAIRWTRAVPRHLLCSASSQ
jgi:hypothetical protein